MGHHHTSPRDCPTIFECHGKRSQVFQRIVNDAYNNNPTVTPVLMSPLLLIFAIGIGIMYYRVRRNRNRKNARKLEHAEAHRAAMEKAQALEFTDEV